MKNIINKSYGISCYNTTFGLAEKFKIYYCTSSRIMDDVNIVPHCSTLNFVKDNVSVVCKTKRFDLTHFQDFCTCIVNDLGLDTRYNPQSFASLVLFYTSFYCCSDSNFHRYLFNINRNVHIPTFIAGFIAKLIRETNTQNGYFGFVKGVVKSSTSYKECLLFLKDNLTLEYLTLSFGATKIFGRSYDIIKVRDYTLEILNSQISALESEEYSESDLILKNLQDVCSGFDRLDKNTISINFFEHSAVSDKFGLYRFVSLHPNRYTTAQSSLSSLKDFTLEVLGAFLCYFRPTYHNNEAELIKDKVYAGDVSIDLDGISMITCMQVFIQMKPIVLTKVSENKKEASPVDTPFDTEGSKEKEEGKWKIKIHKNYKDKLKTQQKDIIKPSGARSFSTLIAPKRELGIVRDMDVFTRLNILEPSIILTRFN